MILIIDTTSSDIKLAISNVQCAIDAQKQSLELPGATEKFLSDNGVKFSDLTAIGVVVGPGSFTGIRLGIAYARGLSIGLNIPITPLNLFEIYLYQNPDAIVGIDSGRGDLFISAADLPPQIMGIEEFESFQMKYPKTVGHRPVDLGRAAEIVKQKIDKNEPVIPLYIRPHYANVTPAQAGVGL